MKKHIFIIPLLFLGLFIGFSYLQYSSYRQRQTDALQNRLNRTLSTLPDILLSRLQSHLDFHDQFIEMLTNEREKPVVFLRHERSEILGFWIFDAQGTLHEQSSKQTLTLDDTDRIRFDEMLQSCFGSNDAVLFVPGVSMGENQPIFLMKFMPARRQVLVTSFDGGKLFKSVYASVSGDPWILQVFLNNQLFWKSGPYGSTLFAESDFHWLNTAFSLKAFPDGMDPNNLAHHQSRTMWIFGLLIACGFSLFMGYFLYLNYRKRLAESRYKTLFEKANEGYFLTEDGKIHSCNQRFKDILGVHDQLLLGQPTGPFFIEMGFNLGISEDEIARLLSGRGPHRFELERRKAIGGEQVLRFHITPVTIGESQFILGMISDITQQKSQERMIRNSESRYRLLVEHAPEWIFITQKGRIQMTNQNVVDVTGFQKGAIENQLFESIVYENDLLDFQETMATLSKAKDQSTTLTVRVKDAKGQLIWLEICAHEFPWENTSSVLNFARNITQEKELEDKLLQAQKMEAIGTLAAGIAHDFNNLLQAVQGNVSILLGRKLDAGRDREKYLTDIERHVKRGSELTKQLLGFAKGGQYHVRPVLINDILERTASMFARTRKELKMNYQFQKALWTVDVDEGQIEQVLINLFMNAWQAMPNGGVITIRTEMVNVSPALRESFDLIRSNYIKVSVTDTGTGMDEETRSRVFEPFFTKKEKKTGSGLGLASAYGIIKNHKGAIEVKSMVGEGSTFNIYLPISNKPYQKLEDTTGSIFFGEERILIVDDEEQVLNMTSEMLSTLGYHVLQATSGEEAIAYFNAPGEPIDLIVLDMVMPGMSGEETFNAIKKISPKQKILLCSGYSMDHVAKNLIKEGASGFLGKPFGIKILSARVKQILHPR